MIIRTCKRVLLLRTLDQCYILSCWTDWGTCAKQVLPTYRSNCAGHDRSRTPDRRVKWLHWNLGILLNRAALTRIQDRRFCKSNRTGWHWVFQVGIATSSTGSENHTSVVVLLSKKVYPLILRIRLQAARAELGSGGTTDSIPASGRFSINLSFVYTGSSRFEASSRRSWKIDFPLVLLTWCLVLPLPLPECKESWLSKRVHGLQMQECARRWMQGRWSLSPNDDSQISRHVHLQGHQCVLVLCRGCSSSWCRFCARREGTRPENSVFGNSFEYHVQDKCGVCVQRGGRQWHQSLCCAAMLYQVQGELVHSVLSVFEQVGLALYCGLMIMWHLLCCFFIFGLQLDQMPLLDCLTMRASFDNLQDGAHIFSVSVNTSSGDFIASEFRWDIGKWSNHCWVDATNVTTFSKKNAVFFS